MKDINSKADISKMVHSFYHEVQKDDLIGPIFNEKIKTENWPKHLEKMISFWTTVLFAEQGYRGNPFARHIGLGLAKNHFDRWIKLFKGSLEKNFEGPKASEALMRAEKMRVMFEIKLDYIKSNNGHRPIL